jgi:multiple sugar transport system ATP-binding protein
MLRKVPSAEIARRVQAAAEALSLTSLLGRLPRALSGGERQRVAVGRALVRQPKVFLFDEPLSNLDATLRLQMRIELKRLQARLGTTTLYVTHDQVEAMTMGHRLAVLKDGRIQQVGEPLAVYQRPVNLFVAGFVGSPPMNLLRGVIESAGSELRFHPAPHGAGTEVPASGWRIPDAHAARLLPQVGKPVVLGFRPEAVSPVGSETSVLHGERVRLAVQVIELLGRESFVHGLLGGSLATARWPAGGLPVPGQSLPVWLDLAQAHYFDATTGMAIR